MILWLIGHSQERRMFHQENSRTILFRYTISEGTSALNCDIPTKLLNEMTILSQSLWNAARRGFGKLKLQSFSFVIDF